MPIATKFDGKNIYCPLGKLAYAVFGNFQYSDDTRGHSRDFLSVYFAAD